MAVRRESVLLTLEDHFSTGMAKAAASTALLNRELNSLSGQSVRTSAATQRIDRDFDGVSRSADRADKSINQLTGRLRLFADLAAILGPSLAPIGAVAVPAVTGLASQLGFAAIGAGVFAGSMRGLGDAISAMNKADLEPTTENIAKAEDALAALAPAARDFAKELRGLGPELKAIRDLGAEALVPGLTESLDDLERLAPKVAMIFEAVGGALGDIASSSAASLASDRWADFFEFIATDAPQALSELAATTGNVTHALAEMWQAFDPLNDDFSGWLLDVSRDFDRWATGLDQTQGFQEFVAYIRENGPQVADTFAAIGNAVLQIVQASAPLGGPVLAALEASADAVAAIADSDLGTPIMAGVAALSLLNRTLAVTATLSKTSLSTGMFAGLGTVGGQAKAGGRSIRGLSADVGILARNYTTAGAASQRMASQSVIAATNVKQAGLAAGKAAGLIGGLAVASTGAADGMGLTNTASLALMGTMLGPFGTAAGAGIGLFMDWRASAADAEAATAQFAVTLEAMSSIDVAAKLDEARAILAAMGDDSIAAPMMAQRIKQLEEALRGKTQAEEESEAAAKRSAIAYAKSVGANSVVRRSSLMTAKQIEAQAKAMLEAHEAAETLAQTFGGLGESLNDSEKSFGQWVAEMEASRRALANFNDNSIKAAKKGLDEGLTKSLRNAGKEGALRMEQLANGTKSEIARANQSWRAMQQEIERTRRVTQQLSKTPIEIKTDKALAALARLRAQAEDVAGEYRINFIVTQSNAINRRRDPNFPSAPGSADGGTVPKTGMAYADRHPYLLADGEEVISNRYGQADRHRDLLKAINANRLADGGTAGDKKRVVRSFEFDSDSLSSQLPRAWFEMQMETTRAQLEAANQQVSAAKVAARAAEEQDKAADKALEAAESLYVGVQSQVASQFTIDPLAQPTSAWGKSVDPFTSLADIIARTQAFDAGSTSLSSRGLDGAALAYGLQSESNLSRLSAMTDADLQKFEDMFNQASAGVANTATLAAELTYGSQVAQASAAAASSEAQLQLANGTLWAIEERIGQLVARVDNLGQQAVEMGPVNAAVTGAAAAQGFSLSGRNAARRRRRDR